MNIIQRSTVHQKTFTNEMNMLCSEGHEICGEG